MFDESPYGTVYWTQRFEVEGRPLQRQVCKDNDNRQVCNTGGQKTATDPSGTATYSQQGEFVSRGLGIFQNNVTNNRESAGTIIRQPHDHSGPFDSRAGQLVVRRLAAFNERPVDSGQLLEFIQVTREHCPWIAQH